MIRCILLIFIETFKRFSKSMIWQFFCLIRMHLAFLLTDWMHLAWMSNIFEKIKFTKIYWSFKSIFWTYSFVCNFTLLYNECYLLLFYKPALSFLLGIFSFFLHFINVIVPLLNSFCFFKIKELQLIGYTSKAFYI